MDQIPALDAIALVWFLVAATGYSLITSLPALERRSIAGGVQQHRLGWMLMMAQRENRIIDGQLLGALSQGNAFFASTSAIAIGGIAAVTGSGDKALVFVERIPYAAPTSPLLWELKIVLLMGIFMFAFFKFAWAFRLSHYAAIMIGSMPPPESHDAEARKAHAIRTAVLIGIAADHANSGLRAFYYAMAAGAWLFHPWAFMLATTWVVLILARRDFYSRANAIVSAPRALAGSDDGPNRSTVTSKGTNKAPDSSWH